jgi:hypothetical protein
VGGADVTLALLNKPDISAWPIGRKWSVINGIGGVNGSPSCNDTRFVMTMDGTTDKLKLKAELD